LQKYLRREGRKKLQLQGSIKLAEMIKILKLRRKDFPAEKFH
jgi:hypothetical protein